MKSFAATLHKGFTLVELLVVIAVIGVLATVVIIAVDPLEQLARGEDTGRISTITQVGNGMAAYATSAGGGVYPFGATDAPRWFDILKEAGEIKGNVTVKAATAGVCGVAGGINNMQENICYESADGADAVLWTILASKSSKAKGKCASTQIPVAVWIGSQGKAGVGCIDAPITTQPTAATPTY